MLVLYSLRHAEIAKTNIIDQLSNSLYLAATRLKTFDQKKNLTIVESLPNKNDTAYSFLVNGTYLINSR